VTGSPDLPGLPGTPIARCPGNGVEAFSFPFHIARGRDGAADFLFLEVHLWNMSEGEKAEAGDMVEVTSASQLEEMGYPRDPVGVFIVGG